MCTNSDSSARSCVMRGANRGHGLTKPLFVPLVLFPLLEHEKRRVRGVNSDKERCSLCENIKNHLRMS